MTPRARVLVWILVGSAALALAVVAAGSLQVSSVARAVVDWSRTAGLAGALVYGVGYVVAAVFLLPGLVLTLGAGFAWGPVWGVALVSPASVLAATVAFLLGRTSLRARVEQKVGTNARLAALDQAMGENGFKVVLLLRLSPVLPFNLLNYALALTGVRLRDFVAGSAVGMFPATVLYVYLGSLVTSTAELWSGQPPTAGLLGGALTWGGLVATLMVVVLLGRMSRVALKRVLAEVR
jgi:uncharacterized membrane protein YdjX (TVP38/TMEM64 family)